MLSRIKRRKGPASSFSSMSSPEDRKILSGGSMFLVSIVLVLMAAVFVLFAAFDAANISVVIEDCSSDGNCRQLRRQGDNNGESGGGGYSNVRSSLLQQLGEFTLPSPTVSSTMSTTTKTDLGASSPTISTRTVLNDSLLQITGIDAIMVWEHLLQEGKAIMAEKDDDGGKKLTAMEVGMHHAKQCLYAAEHGLEVHCVEPSPRSFGRINKQISESTPEQKKLVHLHQVAASSKSGETVPFTTSGQATDHVGSYDPWTMTKDGARETKGARVITVPTKRLDEIVESVDDPNGLFVLKVDTQGYEPEVLAGLQESLASHRVQHLIMEFWPHGMDLLADKPNACLAADVLDKLLKYGYTLYVLPMEAHWPTVPKEIDQNREKIQATRPMDDLKAYCQWYYDMETKYPKEKYKVGYWSDIVAVAPNRQLKLPTTTDVGKVLSGINMSGRASSSLSA